MRPFSVYEYREFSVDAAKERGKAFVALIRKWIELLKLTCVVLDIRVCVVLSLLILVLEKV